jgi:hypothetical protein
MIARLHLVPVDWQMAQDFVEGWHRTHPKPPPGHKFCVGVAAGSVLVGVAIVSWPVVAELPARKGWDTPSRPRDNDSYLSTARTLWEAS